MAPEHRQVAVVDRLSRVAYHVGEASMPAVGHAAGSGCCAMGNLLADPGVPAAMVAAHMAAAVEPLAERRMRALEAGLATGGEVDDERGAGLLVNDTQDWPAVDLRVDWHAAPVAELRALWDRYAPQQSAYLARATDLRDAPGFGRPTVSTQRG